MRGAILAAALFAAAAPAAHAYCVHNQLKTRDIAVEQEAHPDKLRDSRRFNFIIKPGQRQCCAFHNLDCNPLGRKDAIVHLSVTIPGDPPYHCGFPAGAEPMVKVTGGGHVRVQPNPRYSKSAWPYIVRVRTHDKDITGPRGLQCPQQK